MKARKHIRTGDDSEDDTLVIDQSVTRKDDKKNETSSSSSNTTGSSEDKSVGSKKKNDSKQSEEQLQVPPSKSKLKTAIKICLLVSLAPTLLSMPLILKKAGEAVANNRMILYYIWAGYAVIWAALVYSKRDKTSFSSFINHNLQWLIVALGAFIVLDIPKMIQQVDLRREVLFVWCTITWIPNILLYYFDNTDYIVKEAKEEERSQRKKKKEDERRARMEEKRKKKQQERMDRYTPTQRILLNTAVYLGLALLVCLLAWQTYRWYLQTQQSIQERVRASQPTFEPNYDDYN